MEKKDQNNNGVRKHIIILERHQGGDIRRKEKYEELERKYNIKKRGIRTLIEELKQRPMQIQQS